MSADRTPVVYVTCEIPQAGVETLEERCEVRCDRRLPPEKEHVVSRLSELEADALFCTVADEVDAEVMDASPNLAAIGTMSVGYDHIDLDAARERDIPVGHTPGMLTETTADLAWALLLAGARRITEAEEYVRDGEWETWGPTILLGRDVHDATLGIVGMGGIGTATARRGAGFDMDVVYSHTSRNEEAERELADAGITAEYVDELAVFERADVVSLHVPLTDETDGLVDERELKALGEDGVLVNTSRGEVVRTDALDEALASGWIRHAAIDVTDPEPLPPDHRLMRHVPDRLTVTPHIGSASIETRSEMAIATAENIIAGLNGEPLPHSVFEDAGEL